MTPEGSGPRARSNEAASRKGRGLLSSVDRFEGVRTLRQYPLGTDRAPFRYVLPEGLLLRDVKRIAYHLMTLADDFDPENPTGALARREA